MALSYKSFNLKAMTNSILNLLDLANDYEINKGKVWYLDAHNYCQNKAVEYNLPFVTIAGIVAALSPENEWNQNTIDTDSLLENREDCTVSTYDANKYKALDIYYGDICPIERFSPNNKKYGWRKTAAFFQNIVNPTTYGRVTIDRHATRIVHGYKLTASDAIYYANTPKKYEYTEQAYRLAAKHAGYSLPHVLQAITWLTYRRLYVTRKRKQDRDLSTVPIVL